MLALKWGEVMKSFKHLYNLSFQDKGDYLHFAAHSHHPWPDCTFDAHKEYWKDSAKHLDGKWTHIFTNILPKTQKNIADILNLSHPEMIAIAPNTHEFVTRLFSALENQQSAKILTTDAEFHSFRRQLQRLLETKKVQAEIVPVEPYETFEKRWIEKINSQKYDMVFTSHVFFNSGLMCPDFESWISKVPMETMVVIDGYHSFCAIPIDLKKYEDRIFFIAGGYKYAQGGEGVCFMTIPKSSKHRPVNTGWFASFETLNQPMKDEVQYSNSGMRFAGSTFEPSGCYRFNAVVETLKKEEIPVQKIHERIMELKKYFISSIEKSSLKELSSHKIISDRGDATHSHFVTFRTDQANTLEKTLAENNIIVDSRGDRLRFGFGLYHDLKDIDSVIKKMERIFS